jgi:hypothetical protein
MPLIKKFIVIVWILLLSLSVCSAQTVNDSGSQGSDMSSIYPELKASLQPTISYLKRKSRKYGSETRFLKSLFYYVHRKHLKRYSQQSSPDALTKSGTYDCVTGTAVYALLLGELKIPYEIWEMNYHVYLTMNVEDTEIVFESTNPVDGFINLNHMIAQHHNHYEEEAKRFHQDQKINTPIIHRAISLRELSGLQLFNQAIQHLQQEERDKAIKYVQQALDYYPSDRIVMLAKLIDRK